MGKEMKIIRLRLLNEMTEAQRIYGNQVRLRLEMERETLERDKDLTPET